MQNFKIYKPKKSNAKTRLKNVKSRRFSSKNQKIKSSLRGSTQEPKVEVHLTNSFAFLQVEEPEELKVQIQAESKVENKFKQFAKEGKKKSRIKAQEELDQFFTKSSYCIVLIPLKKFIDLGAIQSENGIYFINRMQTEVENLDCNEVCIVFGVRANNINEVTDSNSSLILSLKKDFRDIEDISDLNLSRVTETIAPFVPDIQQLGKDDNDMMVLFNIEPKATGFLSIRYPNCQISLPGGSMDKNDLNDYWNTAKREFKEEVGFELSPSSQVVKSIYVKSLMHKFKRKHNKFYHFSMMRRQNTKFHQSMYFLVQF